MRVLVFLLITCLAIITMQGVYSETISEEEKSIILITKSNAMEQTIFDGKWSYVTEWKPTSWNKLTYEDGSVMHLRTAHQGDFIYIFVDFQSDMRLDKHVDKATVCFDSQNNKSKYPDEDDYCFTVSLDQNQGSVFQGGSLLVQDSHLKKIENPSGFIAVSKPSDENDRYSKIPHSSYEFRIPLDLIQRSDNYGFFVSVYEANSDVFYNWPQSVKRIGFFDFPSPEKWGNLVSPDKSIPEFEVPLLILSSLIFLIILLNRKWFPSRI